MSLGLSSLLFTFAFWAIERERKQCNLSKRKRLRSIGFSLQLCFHSAAEAGCRAQMNDTLMFPSPLPPVSVLSSRGMSLRWCGSATMSLCLILLNATSPVNACPFCHCRFQAVSWLCGGGLQGVGWVPEGMIFLRAEFYWIIPYSLVPLGEVELSSLPVALKNTWLQCW